MRSLAIVFAFASLTGLSAGCARHGAAGEACSAPGLEDPNAIGQCAAGFVCAPDRSTQSGNGQSPHWDTSVCRETCASNVDCTATGTSCRSVAGADYVMACQPD